MSIVFLGNKLEVLTGIAIHLRFREVSYSTISWPAVCSFATISRNTRAIGGRGLTTPSSGMMPTISGLDEKVSKTSFLHGIEGSCESNFQCPASITNFVTATIELKDLVMGPTVDGTCCWPSMDTSTPRYDSRPLCRKGQRMYQFACYESFLHWV